MPRGGPLGGLGCEIMHMSGPPPQVAPSDALGKSRKLGWLWAVGGVAAASVVWLAAVLVMGDSASAEISVAGGQSAPQPDVYRFTSDFCAKIDAKPFADAGYQQRAGSRADEREGLPDPALDLMQCVHSYVSAGGKGSARSVTKMWIHKKTDPGPELQARFRVGGKQRGLDESSFTVEKVDGIGQQAFLESLKSGPLGGAHTLVVRDGWVVYEATWATVDATGGAAGQTVAEITDMLKKSAQGSLENLRSR